MQVPRLSSGTNGTFYFVFCYVVSMIWRYVGIEVEGVVGGYPPTAHPTIKKQKKKSINRDNS